MKYAIGYIFLIAIFVILLAAGYRDYSGLPTEFLPSFAQNSVDKAVAEPVRPQPVRDSRAAIHILFIGNSFSVGLPEALDAIASSDSESPYRLDIQSVLIGGAHLIDTFDNPEAQKMLHSQHWDFVVLQEWSGWALFPGQDSVTSEAAKKWKAAIEEISAKPLFFEIWADKPGSTNYLADHSVLPEQIVDWAQKRVREQTDMIARIYDFPVVEIGEYMTLARKLPKAPDVYRSDKHHQNPTGSYLAGLVFYRKVTGRSLDHVTYKPTDLTIEQIQLLRDIASTPM